MRVIAISESVEEHLIRDFKVKQDCIRLIYNGIDVEDFREHSPHLSSQGCQINTIRTDSRNQKKTELGLGQGPVVGIISRLSAEKGHNYLILAMAEVLKNLPQAQLLIVGEGRTKQELVSLTKALGMDKSVFFIPSVMWTQEILSIMDVFVLPSLKEGLGLSLMEAEAAGLAVIGTEVGGIKALIKHGYNGLLVRPRDVTGLASAILELLQDEGKRAHLGKNALNFIKQDFSLEKMVRKTEEVYLEIIVHVA